MKIVPYLKFYGNCEEVLDYYKEIFDGEITYLQRYGEAPEGMWDTIGNENKIMHAAMSIGGAAMYFSDMLKGGDNQRDGNVAITLELDENDDIDAVYEGLSRRGTILVPIQDTFWNARHATVVDKFGVNWILNRDKG